MSVCVFIFISVSVSIPKSMSASASICICIGTLDEVEKALAGVDALEAMVAQVCYSLWVSFAI